MLNLIQGQSQWHWHWHLQWHSWQSMCNGLRSSKLFACAMLSMMVLLSVGTHRRWSHASSVSAMLWFGKSHHDAIHVIDMTPLWNYALSHHHRDLVAWRSSIPNFDVKRCRNCLIVKLQVGLDFKLRPSGHLKTAEVRMCTLPGKLVGSRLFFGTLVSAQFNSRWRHTEHTFWCSKDSCSRGRHQCHWHIDINTVNYVIVNEIESNNLSAGVIGTSACMAFVCKPLPTFSLGLLTLSTRKSEFSARATCHPSCHCRLPFSIIAAFRNTIASVTDDAVVNDNVDSRNGQLNRSSCQPDSNWRSYGTQELGSLIQSIHLSQAQPDIHVFAIKLGSWHWGPKPSRHTYARR